MQMCLGATYSWSVYVQPLKILTGLQQGPVQVPFTVFYFMFPLTMMFAGTLLPKTGPRLNAMVGGLLFGGGWLIASLGAGNFLFTTLGIGLVSGVGAGMAYIVPIAVCIQWFPKNKGLVTGIAVAGFGGGAALVSQAGGWLMKTADKTPFETFFIFGLIFLAVICVAGSVMHFPETHKKQQTKQINLREILSHPTFQILYFSMFIGLAAGFAINANLKELFHDGANTAQVGITAVSLFAVANALGRIIWGIIFDRVESAIAIQANLILQALVLLAAPFLLSSIPGFLAVSFLTGFNYGGVLVLYVSCASRYWGGDRVGKIYGFLFSSNIPASFAPILAGMVFDRFQSFDFALYGLGGLLIIGAFLIQKNGAKLERGQVAAS